MSTSIEAPQANMNRFSGALDVARTALYRVMDTAGSIFGGATEALGSRLDSMPTLPKAAVGGVAIGAVGVVGYELISPSPAEARPAPSIREPAFYVANTPSETREVLHDLKQQWRKGCKERGGKDNFYVVRIGQEQRGLTEEEEASPPEPSYTIASMSCRGRSSVTVSVKGGGEDLGHEYDSWTHKYKARKFYTEQVKVPVNLSTRLEASAKDGRLLALRSA